MKKFLLISCLLALSTVPVLAEENPNQQRIDEIEAQIKELQAELKELKGETGDGIGQTITVENVDITITDIYYSTLLNNMTDKEADKVLVIKYDVMNNSDEEIFVQMIIDVYADGMKLENYAYINNINPTISPGKGAKAVAGFAVIGDIKELELEFRNDFLGDIGEETIVINAENFETVEE